MALWRQSWKRFCCCYGPALVLQVEKDMARDPMKGLLAGLSDSDANVRPRGAYELSLFGPEATDAIPALVNTLCDQRRPVRSKSAQAANHLRLVAEESGSECGSGTYTGKRLDQTVRFWFTAGKRHER